MRKIIELKRYLLDKQNITHELYRPLIYWYYLLNPFKKTGQAIFPALKAIEAVLTDLPVNTNEFLLNRGELEKYMCNSIHEYWHYFSTGYGKAFVGKTAEHFVSLRLSNFRGGGIHRYRCR